MTEKTLKRYTFIPREDGTQDLEIETIDGEVWLFKNIYPVAVDRGQPGNELDIQYHTVQCTDLTDAQREEQKHLHTWIREVHDKMRGEP